MCRVKHKTLLTHSHILSYAYAYRVKSYNDVVIVLEAIESGGHSER